MRKARALPFAMALLLGVPFSACRRAERNATLASSEPATDLQNGMYAVIGVFDTRPEAETSANGKRIIADHHLYAPPSERGAPQHVVIDPTQYVPFVLASAPGAVEDGAGRTLVSIELDPQYTERLKNFTTAHLGKSAAMIVGGELASVHKIRSVIAEGKLQVTSCGADVCKVLYSKLVGDR